MNRENLNYIFLKNYIAKKTKQYNGKSLYIRVKKKKKILLKLYNQHVIEIYVVGFE